VEAIDSSKVQTEQQFFNARAKAMTSSRGPPLKTKKTKKKRITLFWRCICFESVVHFPSYGNELDDLVILSKANIL
jgi:hypothetical protein